MAREKQKYGRVTFQKKKMLEEVCSYHGQSFRERLDRLIEQDYQLYLAGKSTSIDTNTDGLGAA